MEKSCKLCVYGTFLDIGTELEIVFLMKIDYNCANNENLSR